MGDYFSVGSAHTGVSFHCHIIFTLSYDSVHCYLKNVKQKQIFFDEDPLNLDISIFSQHSGITVGLLYMARNYQSSVKQFLLESLCFDCMTGCVLLSAETCVEQTPSSTASSLSDNVSSINIWGALKVSMSALYCPAS